MNKTRFIEILHSYNMNLPIMSIEWLLDSYHQELEQEIRNEIKIEAEKLKKSIVYRMKYYSNRIYIKASSYFAQLVKDTFVYILKNNYELRLYVRDIIQKHEDDKLFEIYQKANNEARILYGHELDTIVKKQLIEKWSKAVEYYINSKLNK